MQSFKSGDCLKLLPTDLTRKVTTDYVIFTGRYSLTLRNMSELLCSTPCDDWIVHYIICLSNICN